MPASNGEDEGAGAGAGATPKRHRARLPPARSPAGRGRGGHGGRQTGSASASASASMSGDGGGSSSTLGSAVLRESSIGTGDGSSSGITGANNTERNGSSPRAQPVSPGRSQRNRQQQQAQQQAQQQQGSASPAASPNRQPSQRRPDQQQTGRGSMAGGRGVGGRSGVRFAPSARGGSNRSMNGSRSSRNGSMSSLCDPTALYRMLESGLDKGGGGKASGRGGGGGGGGGEGDQQGGAEHEAKPMTRLEEIRRAERLDKMFDAVRRWLRSNSNSPSNSSNNTSSSSANPVDPNLKHEAATHLGHFGMTALHLLCKLPNPPVDIVADLIECAPETLQWAESSGWLPIHLAVASGASLVVLVMLCDAHLDGKIAQDRRLRTPLHFGKSGSFSA